MKDESLESSIASDILFNFLSLWLKIIRFNCSVTIDRNISLFILNEKKMKRIEGIVPDAHPN